MKKQSQFFNSLLLFVSFIIPIFLIASFIVLFIEALPIIKHMGVRFFVNQNWNVVTSQYGVVPFLWGTLFTSIVAMIVSFFFSLSLSITMGEILKNSKINVFFSSLIEIISSIPSVVMGLWGIIFVFPFVREIQMFFSLTPSGASFLSSIIVLSFMIIPFSCTLGKEVISMCPQSLKEAAYALGSTRIEVIFKVILPYARSGIFAGFMLSFSRVVGETMAVTMLIGNTINITTNLLSPGSTMSSLIANEFGEASEKLHSSALMGVGLVLLIITFAINIFGKYIIKKTALR